MVLLAKRDAAARERLLGVIHSAGHRAESFADGQALLARLRSAEGPACVVSEMQLPEMECLLLFAESRILQAPVSLVFLTSRADVPRTVLAMKRGAIDVLETPVRSERLLLEAIATGLARARSLAESRRRLAEVAARFEDLTRREREVFALVTSGLANKEVASELRIALRTVKVHRARVMQKMGAPTLAHLVRLADLLGVREAP
jgi:FixJ family two-component response regulator